MNRCWPDPDRERGGEGDERVRSLGKHVEKLARLFAQLATEQGALAAENRALRADLDALACEVMGLEEMLADLGARHAELLGAVSDAVGLGDPEPGA